MTARPTPEPASAAGAGRRHGSPRRCRLTPPLSVWIFIALCLAVIVGVRWSDLTGDHAIDNIVTLISGFIATCALSGWFTLRSGYSRTVRAAGAGAMLAAVVLFFAMMEIHQVSGEMVPTFRPRWASEPDRLLEVPGARQSRAQADLSSTTPNDFPQFLGPERDNHLQNVRLVRDWEERPPKEIWRQRIGAGWSGFAAVNGYTVTMEQRGEHELVSCYDIASGRLVWFQGVKARHRTTLGGVGPRSTPTIHQGKVYTLGATGTLLCLDGATGEVIWRDDILERYGVTPETDAEGVAWGRAASPLVVDDLLVVPAGGPQGGPYVSLVAFNKETGQLVWEGGQHQVAYSSPVLATLCGVRQIVSVNEACVSGHIPSTGEVLWETEWPGSSTGGPNVSQPVVLPGDRLLLSKGYGGGAAMLQLSAEDSDSGFDINRIWRNQRVLKTKFTNVVVHEGYVYGLSDGILECVRLADGRRQWKRGRYGHGQLLGVGDVILVQSEGGEVVMIEAEPSRLRELASLPALDGKTWNNLCLYGKYLLARNAEEAVCYELPLKADRKDS